MAPFNEERAIMRTSSLVVFAVVLSCALAVQPARGETAATQPAGVVGHVKVLSDKVADVSSIEAWKKSFIKDGMTDKDKALTIFRSKVMFHYQDAPPAEFLTEMDCIHDAIKEFNVYGYGMCCCASAIVECLARNAGLEARAWGINGHSVPEVQWDNAWHLIDTSLINYFPKPDGQIASVQEIKAAISEWYDKNPGYKGNGAKITEFMRADGWTGWKKGPALLAACPFYDGGGFWTARTHGWNSTMQEYDGSNGTPFPFEYGYSQGYEVNIQLRPGERLTRNWFNTGLHLNGVAKTGGEPGCLKEKIGNGFMAYIPKYGDLTANRIGSGKLEYTVPLADASFLNGAWKAENLVSKAADKNGPAVHAKDPAQPGVLEIRMPCSYVYLSGVAELNAVIGEGGKIRALFSDNNGLDWKDVATIEKSGEQKLDLQALVVRRYDYLLRLVLYGKGTGLESLKLTHAFQCSQRALPALDKGANTITFSAGPQEGTVTIQGSSTEGGKGKQIELVDFHPVLNGVAPKYMRDEVYGGKTADVTFSVATPKDMIRLRFGCHYRCRDKDDKWDFRVSFDGGKTFKSVQTVAGPTQGQTKYLTVSEVPAGTKEAQVRFVGSQRNTTCILSARIDADYVLPCGGFRPVKVTYAWEEGGLEKQDVHVAKQPNETYTINCAAKPLMKSIALELAD